MKNSHNLINIRAVNSRILLDIKYATHDNFIGRPMYSHAVAFIQEPIALKLDAIQRALELKGLGLKIWDAYRPHSVQHMLWAQVPDERYVAHPEKGSSHNRGAAVDVTLVDAFGNELAMPTKFDDFTVNAHCNYMDLPQEILKNRDLLASMMTAHGFTTLETEWWHFNDEKCLSYPVLDVSFEELHR